MLSQINEKEAAELAQRMLESRFDFNDFLKQSRMMKNMGSMGNVANMIPGMAGKISPKQLSSIEVR